MTRPAKPDVIQKRIQTLASQPNLTCSDGLWGATIGLLKGLGITDQERYQVCGWLFFGGGGFFQPLHSKDLSQSQRAAIVKWVGPVKLPDNSWAPDPDFWQEWQWVTWVVQDELNPKEPYLVAAAQELGGVVTDPAPVKVTHTSLKGMSDEEYQFLIDRAKDWEYLVYHNNGNACKSDLEDWLTLHFGIDRGTGHTIANLLTETFNIREWQEKRPVPKLSDYPDLQGQYGVAPAPMKAAVPAPKKEEVYYGFE